MDLIPSLDLLDGNVVRLTRGDFSTVRVYGDPDAIVDRLGIEPGMRVHVVDLEGSRRGRPIETAVVTRLARRSLRLQVGGGIRSIDDARTWIDCGAERLVAGTAAAESPSLLASLVNEFGPDRIVPAVDVELRGADVSSALVRVRGWETTAAASLMDVLRQIERLAIPGILVTDISKDGALGGPSFGLYRSLRGVTPLRIIASGGVSTTSDVVSLGRIGNVSGCVIGKALLEGRVSLAAATARAATEPSIPERVIPCLDVRDGRVVKGVRFSGLRDAGDPVECARRYEAEGADEIAILDVSATDAGRATALETVRSVAESIFIPLTVGGGVRSIEDFRALLRAGADRVAINTAALRRPELISEAAEEFGSQAVVLSCDVRRDGGRFVAVARSGKEPSDADAIAWCRQAADLGAGEILLTSVDRDGTSGGFDLELLRAVTSSVGVSVIASGGAGRLEHFREAIESGGARAVLAASLFHDRLLTIGDVKRHLEAEGIPVRW